MDLYSDKARARKKKEFQRCAALYAAAFALPVMLELAMIYALLPVFAFCAKLGAFAFVGLLGGGTPFVCRIFLGDIPLEKHFESAYARYAIIGLYTCAIVAAVLYLQPLSFAENNPGPGLPE